MSRFRALLACATLSLLTAGPTCDLLSPADGVEDLADLEKAAIRAAGLAAGAFGQAIGTSQSAAGQQDASDAVKPGDLTVGSCPEVTTSATLGDAALDVTIDFKDGCALPLAADYTCAGRASGQIDFLARTLELGFEEISCTGETSLNGGVNLSYSLSAAAVELEGQWDLTYTVEGEQVITTGNGAARYDLEALSSTVSEFNGLLAEGDSQWEIAVSGLMVSYAGQQSHVPYGGTITLTGLTIRQLTLRFNENSPSSGEIEVSIASGPFFTVNLYEL